MHIEKPLDSSKQTNVFFWLVTASFMGIKPTYCNSHAAAMKIPLFFLQVDELQYLRKSVFHSDQGCRTCLGDVQITIESI